MPTFGENSIQEFMSHMQKNPPAYSSLYHVQFNTLPKVLSPGGAPISSDFTLDDTGSLARNLSYYANEVSIPSRQITTGEQKPVGSMYRYPTSTTFSEISMQFTLPRNMLTRTFFERWMNYISNDANQYVSPYFDCVTVTIADANLYNSVNSHHCDVLLSAPIGITGSLEFKIYNSSNAVVSTKVINVLPNTQSITFSNTGTLTGPLTIKGMVFYPGLSPQPCVQFQWSLVIPPNLFSTN